MTIRIGILYTQDSERAVSTNPGDDIVRDGQRYLLETFFAGETVEWVTFNRNYPGKWFRSLPRSIQTVKSKKIWPFWFVCPVRHTNELFSCDYIINASGPLFYGTRKSYSLVEPWFLVLSRMLKKKGAPSFLNLAFGSHFFRGDQETALKKYMARAYCRRMSGCSRVLTSRDGIAHRYIEEVGGKSTLLPCPSLLSRKYYGVNTEPGSYILINFHPAGSRAKYGEPEYNPAWMAEFKKVISMLERGGHEMKFIFHEQLELDLAEKYFPIRNYKYVIPESIPEYLSIYGAAGAAFTCRIHGAYAAASFGVPSFCVGHDSRLKMIDLLGLPSADCDDIKAETIYCTLMDMLKSREKWRQKLLEVCDGAEQQYLSLLKKYLS